jgi:hypothetical protein
VTVGEHNNQRFVIQLVSHKAANWIISYPLIESEGEKLDNFMHWYFRRSSLYWFRGQ